MNLVVNYGSFSHPNSLYSDLIYFQTKLIETVQLGLDDQSFDAYRVLISSGNSNEFYKQHYKLVDMVKIKHYSNLLVDCILDNLALEKEINANRNLISDEIAKSILNKSEFKALDISWLSSQYDSVIAHAIIRFMGKKHRVMLSAHGDRFIEITKIITSVVSESNKKARI